MSATTPAVGRQAADHRLQDHEYGGHPGLSGSGAQLGHEESLTVLCWHRARRPLSLCGNSDGFASASKARWAMAFPPGSQPPAGPLWRPPRGTPGGPAWIPPGTGQRSPGTPGGPGWITAAQEARPYVRLRHPLRCRLHHPGRGRGVPRHASSRYPVRTEALRRARLTQIRLLCAR